MIKDDFNTDLPLRIHPPERFNQLFRNRFFLRVRVHHVQKVRERNFPAFVLHEGLELCDGGRHAQGPHDDSQLVHGLDLTRPGVEVETFPELVNILLLEKPGLQVIGERFDCEGEKW